jgi:hypothetical protein
MTEIVRENVARETVLHTDESKLYHHMKEHGPGQATVKHTKEYVRGTIQTDTIENYF